MHKKSFRWTSLKMSSFVLPLLPPLDYLLPLFISFSFLSFFSRFIYIVFCVFFLFFFFLFFLLVSFFSPLLPWCCRLIPNMENSLESSLLHVEEVEEEEVWLYWIDGNKEPHGKSIRHLAQDSKGHNKTDTDIITYYR